MLRWSLARALNLGIVSQRLFQKELVRAAHRKSTIDVRALHKPELMKPDSREYEQKRLQELRRSRSIPLDLNHLAVNDDLSSQMSDSEESMEIGVEITR